MSIFEKQIILDVGPLSVAVVVRADGTLKYRGREKTPSDNGNGYKSFLISASVDGKKYGRRFYVHRLVARAFISNFSDDMEVNHKDFNKSNNCLDNLEMVTRKENMSHAVSSYRVSSLSRSYGEFIQVLKLHFVDGRTVRDIVQSTGIERTWVERTLRGRGSACHRTRYLKEGNVFNISYFKIVHRTRKLRRIK